MPLLQERLNKQYHDRISGPKSCMDRISPGNNLHEDKTQIDFI